MMRKLQRQTSAPDRLAAYRFIVVFLWSVAATALLLAPPKSLFVVARSPGEFDWPDAHSWTNDVSMLLLALLLILIVAPGVQCIRNKAVREKIASAMQAMPFMPVALKKPSDWCYP